MAEQMTINAYMRRLLSLAAVMLFALCSQAQNNPYKINDHLHDMFVDAYRKRADKEGVAVARDMYRQAVAMGDRKAQCLALTIPVLYCYLHRDIAKYEVESKPLQEKALAYGYDQYYYFAASNKVNLLINLGMQNRAFDYLKQIDSFAKAHKHIYGVYISLISLGQLHYARMETTLAIECYRKAQEIADKSLPQQDKSNVYRRLSECYEQLFMYDDMLKNANRAYNISLTTIAKLRILRDKGWAAFMLGRYDDFNACYDTYAGLKGKINPMSRDNAERDMAVMHMLVAGDYQAAKKNIDAYPDFFHDKQQRLLFSYFTMTGDWKSAALTQEKLYRRIVGKIDTVRKLSLLEMSAQLINYKIDYEHNLLVMERQRIMGEKRKENIRTANLKLSNTRLTLLNSSLEIGRERSRAETLRLSRSNAQLKAARLSRQLEAQRHQRKVYMTMEATAIAICLIALAAVGAYVWSRMSVMRRLNVANAELERNNAELAEARSKAEEESNMKAAFIQNMGEELRAPLNSLVSYSKLIAESSKAPAEEKIHMHRKVRENTDRLLKLVGDVLGKVQA